jgi:hypothetical protein
MLEDVLGVDGESALNYAMFGVLEGAMVHDLRGMEEAECCWLKERMWMMHGRREERRRGCWLTGSG